MVSPALQSRNLSIVNWEKMLDVALHCIRSLLSTSTNCTPHEHLFNFQRKSATEDSIPIWLTRSKSALLKRHLRGSKYEPLVKTVDILEVNPTMLTYASIMDEKQLCPLRHIAPLGDGIRNQTLCQGTLKNWMSLTRLMLLPFYRELLKTQLLRIQFLLFLFLHYWMILRELCQKTLTH